ncbi:MAG: aromatic ring-hydroxylating dioxygenase subunit alpha [Rhodospirillaceae bacterium]|nr:aromatic ring-hydroxylating dioxygenase subunit alpha [Rhodospirillaceae bacterium]
MLTAKQNIRLTRTGRGTVGGSLMRRYWQPVALSEELAPANTGGRPVKPVRLLGEDLVLFRDEQGRIGLIDRHCCHRGADMAYGRLEGGGLRCSFHGWLYDVTGACLEQPAEPKGSDLHTRVRQPAYPCIERNGMVFAFLGDTAAPSLPDLDCLMAPESFSFAWKGWWDCNWLQALEVGIDPAHASFLHRFFHDEEDEVYGQQFRGQTDSIAQTKVFRENDQPEINVETTDYGLRLITTRDLGGGRKHVRVTSQIFPHGIVIPISATMNITQWHVPIDDENCYWYTLFTDFAHPVDQAQMRADRIKSCVLPDYRSIHSRADHWGYDPVEQQTRTYTGMGDDINFHDQWAVESPGRIQDRTKENLGTTDVGIMACRRMLRKALSAEEQGRPLSLEVGVPLETRPLAIDTIGPAEDWKTVWLDHERARRARSPWLGSPTDEAAE